MGDCASKPKGMDLHPTEVPTNKPQPQPAKTISQGINDGVESTAPITTLVDLSESNEPKQDEAGGDVNEPEPASEVSKSTAPVVTQTEKIEVIAKEAEDKSDEGIIVHNTQTKEAHPTTTGVDATKSDLTPTPTSQHKTITPLDVPI